MLYQISDVGVQNMMFTGVKLSTRSRCTNTISNPTITSRGWFMCFIKFYKIYRQQVYKQILIIGVQNMMVLDVEI